jgi:hypothetical protein
MKLRILQIAELEARDAARWYDDHQEGLGDRFLDEYAAALEKIEENPLWFGRLETVTTSKEIRRCLLKRFPYYIVYELAQNEVVVLAVAHARRRPNYWVERLN